MSPEHRAILERMRSSAGIMRHAVQTAPPDQLARAPRNGEWSALETLTHVREVIVHVYGLRIRRLLYEDAPVFVDFDEEGHRRASLARSDTAEILLETIVAEQEQLARLLQTLPDAEWSREGRHPTLGVMSIEFLARRVGEHAEEHAAQITEAVAQAGPCRRPPVIRRVLALIVAVGALLMRAAADAQRPRMTRARPLPVAPL